MAYQRVEHILRQNASHIFGSDRARLQEREAALHQEDEQRHQAMEEGILVVAMRLPKGGQLQSRLLHPELQFL